MQDTRKRENNNSFMQCHQPLQQVVRLLPCQKVSKHYENRQIFSQKHKKR